MQIIPSFSFIHYVFNHLTVWKCRSITNRQIYSFFLWFFFSMLLYSFPFLILPFLLPFMHIIVKLDSCPRHWSFLKTVSLSNVFITSKFYQPRVTVQRTVKLMRLERKRLSRGLCEGSYVASLSSMNFGLFFLYGHNTGKPYAPFCPVSMFKDLNHLGIKNLFSRKSLKVFFYVVIITKNLPRNA